MREWTFLTNHAHVLLEVIRRPDARLRDIAAAVGITERAVANAIADLSEGGYLTKRRVGRRNVYEVHTELPLRHPLWKGHLVAEVFEILLTNREAP